MYLANVEKIEELEKLAGTKADVAVMIYAVEDGLKYTLLGTERGIKTKKQLARELRAIARDLTR